MFAIQIPTVLMIPLFSTFDYKKPKSIILQSRLASPCLSGDPFGQTQDLDPLAVSKLDNRLCLNIVASK